MNDKNEIKNHINSMINECKEVRSILNQMEFQQQKIIEIYELNKTLYYNQMIINNHTPHIGRSGITTTGPNDNYYYVTNR